MLFLSSFQKVPTQQKKVIVTTEQYQLKSLNVGAV